MLIIFQFVFVVPRAVKIGEIFKAWEVNKNNSLNAMTECVEGATGRKLNEVELNALRKIKLKFELKWQESQRKKERFLNSNSLWLQNYFALSSAAETINVSEY